MSLASQASCSKPTTAGRMTCKGCKWSGKSLRTHLNRTKLACKELYDMETLKRESDEVNKLVDIKRKYQRYHSSTEESQRKKAAVSKYREEHQNEIRLAKKESYKKKVAQKQCESLSQNEICSDEPDEEIEDTQMATTKDSDNKCEICEKTFVLKRVKDRHMEHVHSDAPNKSVCDICDKAFDYKDNLNRHMREVHDGEKHKCETCPATFKRSSDLRNHEETGEHYLSYYCGICSKELVFKHFAGMINHVIAKQSEEVKISSDFVSAAGKREGYFKNIKSGILLTCKSRVGSTQVEEGHWVFMMGKAAKLDAHKKRMRKKAEIINGGLKEAQGSKEKTNVTVNFIKNTKHFQEEGQSNCKYCRDTSPFKDDECKGRDKYDFRTIWTLERNIED